MQCRYDGTFNLTTAASKVIDKVNQALTDLMGYTSEELVGTQILDYACDENKPHWQGLQIRFKKESV
jgi:PAS domain S-box-containing protein